MIELSFVSFEFWTVLFSGTATTLISLYLGQLNIIPVRTFWLLSLSKIASESKYLLLFVSHPVQRQEVIF